LDRNRFRWRPGPDVVKIRQKLIFGPESGFDVMNKAGISQKMGLKMGRNEPLLWPVHAVVR